MCNMPKKVKPLKFKHGDMLYSYLNPTVPYPVTYISPSNDPEYQHKYKLSLRDKDGYSYSSHFINEASLKRTKIRR